MKRFNSSLMLGFLCSIAIISCEKPAFIDQIAPFIVSDLLSDQGTANCYAISECGYYYFDASVMGNGDQGIIPEARFVDVFGNELDNSASLPVNELCTCEVIWSDAPVIDSLFYKQGHIYFSSTSAKGNAVIGLYDQNNQLLWSWHIWATNPIFSQLYVHADGTRYFMLDRNLGATGNSFEDGANAFGVFYQWGRKDPFPRNGNYSRVDNKVEKVNVAYAINHPNSFVISSMPHQNWIENPTVESDLLWGNTEEKSFKTIYDPCPPGYRIPDITIWKEFTKSGGNSQGMENFNISDKEYDAGWHFLTGTPKDAWYPVSSYITINGDVNRSSNEYGVYWSNKTFLGKAYSLSINRSWANYWIDPASEDGRSLGASVRCISMMN